MAEVLARISTIHAFLVPAACIAPRSWGLATADAVSWLLLMLPRPGLYAVREAHYAFGRGPLQSLLLAQRRLARPLKDYVVFNRVLRGREDPAAWTVSEVNVAGVENLRAHGTPYIVATGHFAREAVMAMHLPSIAPGQLAHVVSAIPASPPSLSERLGWRLFRVTLDGWARAYGRGLQFVHVGPEHPRPSEQILKQLQKPGAIVYIHVDAPWAWRASERTSLIRSFSGTQLQVFALGAARLARKANCPVVPCLPRIAGDRTVVLE
ncbi:MAG: hypothetical protein IH602_04750 [Bryobacteraceae bacterium]|nr:hypothetical protein [Bryobacteraceae bacterium]